jgi:hypothetical protein
MGKLLLNMTHVQPLSLAKELPFFDNSIELDVLLPSTPCLGFHDPIDFFLFNEIRIELCGGKLIDNL